MAIEMIEILERARAEAWSDEEVVRCVLEGETALYEILMRRYNQRLYRVARAILRDDAEAEDVMQDAYVRAYQHLDQYAGRAPFSTWLTRIAVHEALARVRVRNRKQSLDESPGDGDFIMSLTDNFLKSGTERLECGNWTVVGRSHIESARPLPNRADAARCRRTVDNGNRGDPRADGRECESAAASRARAGPQMAVLAGRSRC